MVKMLHSVVIMQQASGTLSSLNLKMILNIFFSVERVLQCDNGFKLLILLKKVLLQSCFTVFHSVTMVNSLRERTFLPFFKNLFFKIKTLWLSHAKKEI